MEPSAGRRVSSGSGVTVGADGTQADRIRINPSAAATHLIPFSSHIDFLDFYAAQIHRSQSHLSRLLDVWDLGTGKTEQGGTIRVGGNNIVTGNNRVGLFY